MAEVFKRRSKMEITDEVPGRMERFECQTCLTQGQQTKADVFCPNCDEFMCTDCGKMHNAFKAMKGHILVDIKQAKSKLVLFDMKGLDWCNVHQEELKFYCQDHDTLCCSICAVMNHRKCYDIVEVRKIAEQLNPKSSKLKSKLQEIKTIAEKVIKHTELTEEQLLRDIEKIHKEIIKMQEEVIRLFEDLKILVTKRTETFLSETKAILTKTKTCALKHVADAIKALETIDNVHENGTSSQQFIVEHSLKGEVNELHAKVEETGNSLNTATASFHFDETLRLPPYLISDYIPGKLTLEYGIPGQLVLNYSVQENSTIDISTPFSSSESIQTGTGNFSKPDSPVSLEGLDAWKSASTSLERIEIPDGKESAPDSLESIESIEGRQSSPDSLKIIESLYGKESAPDSLESIESIEGRQSAPDSLENIESLDVNVGLLATDDGTEDKLSSTKHEVKITKAKKIMSIDLKQTGDDAGEPLYTGLEFLPDGRLVAVDNRNKKCLIFSEKLEKVGSYNLPCIPQDVVAVTDDEVAITSEGFYRIDFIRFSESNEITLTKTCNVKVQYGSISMKDDENFVVGVVDDVPPARIVSLSGEEKDLNIDFPDKKYPIATSTCTYIRDADKVVLVDREEHTVYIYDIATNTCVVVKDDVIKKPRGVAVSPSGNIVICSTLRDSVVQISPTGGVLSSHKLDTYRPYRVCVSRDETVFALTNNWNGNKVLQLYKFELAR